MKPLRPTDLAATALEYLPPRQSFRTDFTAGLTFALVNIPQGMANALLAGVDPVRGLYTLMAATPIGGLFTGSILMNVSTTSALSVAVGSALAVIPPAQRVGSLLTLVGLVGLIQLLAGLFKLGTLMRFVSNSVMVGFTTGVSLIIILGQLADFTGYDSAFGGRIARGLDTLLRVGQWSWPAVAVGGLVLVLVLALSATRFSKSSYLIALLAGTLLSTALNALTPGLVALIPALPEQLFTLTRPDLAHLSVLLPSALGIAIIGLVQGAGVAQSFPNPDGRFGDPSKDFRGQGLANMAAGLIGGIAGGGSMSGTALLGSAGAQSRWANVIGGLVIIPLVLLLGPLFGLIPLPALAGLLIAVGVQSLRPASLRVVWETNVTARLAMGLTLAATLVMPLQYAIFVGIAVSVTLHVMQSSARVPPSQLQSETVTVLMPYGDLFFAAASNLETLLPAVEGAERAAVVLILRGYEDVGSTFIGVLRRYAEALQAKNGRLYLAGVTPQLTAQLRRTGLVDLIGQERLIPATAQLGTAANASLEDAYGWLNKPFAYHTQGGGANR